MEYSYQRYGMRRREKPRQLVKTLWHCQLEKNLTPIAETISERAIKLVKDIIEGETSQNTLYLFTQWIYPISNPVPSPICSKIINDSQGHKSFRCYDCMQSTSSCICSQCFIKGNHKGHNYIQYESVNGCCDCGNPESWNQKGFCPTHKDANNQRFDIDPSVRKRFLEEYELAFYIYWAFEEMSESDRVKEYYSNQLFESLATVTNGNYQMKILGFEFLSMKFSQRYPKLEHSDRSMLERLFYANQTASGLAQSLQFIFEIFPVQKFRKEVLIQYFKKTLRANEGFNTNHPLAGLNFQFLTCAKLITKMVKDKDLQPLQITKRENIQDTAFIEAAFLKYYEDLDYIGHMKSGHDYHIQHLKLMNVTEMAYYRKFCVKKQKEEEIGAISTCIDEMFLKILAKMIKSARHQKDIMLKCARQLFEFSCKEEPNLYSLAQQRAFAMFVMAYFDGDLSKLYSLDTCEHFLKQMGLEQHNAGQQLRKLCINSLKTVSQIGGHSYSSHNQFEKYYLKTHSQRHVLLFLDTIFQKILILLSRGFFKYDQAVSQLLVYMKANKESELAYVSAHYEQNEQTYSEQKRQNTLFIEKLYVEQLNRMFGFFNYLYLIDLDEIVINNLIGNPQIDKMHDFYGRTLSNFKELTVKDFQSLALTIFQNQEAFESFVSEKTIIEKGRIKNTKPYKPLETYIYKDIFKEYSKPLTEAEVVFLSAPQNNPYKEVNIFNKDTVKLLQQECMNLIIHLSENENSELKAVFSQLSTEFFKIYYLSQSISDSRYFLSLMNENLRKIVSQDLLKQIVLIQKKKEDQQVQNDRIKDEKELSDKKKKEKLMNKKKGIQGKMRNNQALLLKDYKETEQIQNNGETMQQCIICRQSTQESLNYISAAQFTNLIEKSYLKYDKNPHLTITTCSHKIHYSCYGQVYDKNPVQSCFLCKRKVNILVPELSIIKSVQEQKANAMRFLDILMVTLIDQFSSFEQNVNSPQEGLLSHLLLQLARDLVYIGLHDFEYFSKSLCQLYRQLYLIISLQDKKELSAAFQNIRKKNLAFPEYMNQQLNMIQMHVLSLLELKLKLPVENSIKINLPKHIMDNTIKIVDYLTTKESKQPQINNLSIINRKQLFIEIPTSLADLHTHMGFCINCPNITNQTYKCLLCGWTLCRLCIGELYKHGKDVHYEGTVFVGCFNGSIKYISQGKIFEDDSIYFNYMGTSFLQSNALDALSRPDKYKLNPAKLKEIQDLILHYGISQIIYSHNS